MLPITFSHILAISLGAAGGAVCRYLLSSTVSIWLGKDFPYGTLSVNIIGSFLIGLVSIVLIERLGLGLFWRLLIIVGFLGSFNHLFYLFIRNMATVANRHLFKSHPQHTHQC